MLARPVSFYFILFYFFFNDSVEPQFKSSVCFSLVHFQYIFIRA